MQNDQLKTAAAMLSPNYQMRISKIDDLGFELKAIEDKRCKLPAMTRAALQELYDNYVMLKENGVCL